MQRVLTMVSVMKALEDLLYTIVFKSCPWEPADIAEEAYLRMGKVTEVTFTYTFILALLYMLSKGYNITIQVMDKNHTTNLTIVLGITYLVYSAYFLSSDSSNMKVFVNSLLAVMYLVQGATNFRNLAG